jgi:ribosome maturation factor RimP
VGALVRFFCFWAPARRAAGHDEIGSEEVYRDIPADLRALVEPVAADHGFELVDAEVQRGRPGLVRITVDTPRGDGRVPVDALAALSREIETQLDAADWMEGSYRLELASPGLDRVLGREKDFAAACASGCEVKIQTRRPQNGRRRFKGVLVGFEEGTVRLRSDGEEFAIPFDDIEKANTIYKFTSADFKARANK